MGAGLFGLTAAVPAGAVDTVTTYVNSCIAAPVPFVGSVHKPVSGVTQTVSAPATVNPGQTFTIRYQMGPGSFPDKDSGATTVNISRMKLDYDVPANVSFVSASIVAGTGVNVNNPSPGKPPQVDLVRASDGVIDPAGNVIRISGNNETIGNSPSVGTSSEGGILINKTKKDLNGNTTADSSSWFQLPAIDVTYTVTGTAGQQITPTIRLNDDGGFNNVKNYNTSLAKASLLGTQWAQTKCIPRADTSKPADGTPANGPGAGPLATIDIVNPSLPTTTAVSGPGTATIGTSTNYTVNVTASGGTPTGNVTLKDGGTTLGTQALSGGSTTFAVTFSTTGSHSLTAEYAGASGFNPSTSSAFGVTVNKKSSSTSLTGPASITLGDNASYTATVTGAGATGTVTFKDGVTTLGTQALSGGTATFNTTSLAAGSHSITAEYSGDGTFNGSTSNAVSTTVNPKNNGTISGTVTDSSSNPVGDVKVVLFDSTDTGVATVFTDASGAYTLSNVVPGNYKIMFYNKGYATTWNGGAADRGSASWITVNWNDALTQNVQLTEVASVIGTVKGNDNNPVAGVTVRLFDSTGTVIAGTSTDANGDYSFASVAPNANYKVRAIPTDPAYGVTFNGGAANWDLAGWVSVSNGPTRANIALRRVVSLSGHVQNESADPVVGATVALRDKDAGSAAELPPFLFRTFTDSNGDYSIAGIPADRYTVLVKSDGNYQRWWYNPNGGMPHRDQARAFVMTNGGSYTLNVTLIGLILNG